MTVPFTERYRIWKGFNTQLFEGALRLPAIYVSEMERGVLEIEDLRLFGSYQLTRRGRNRIKISEHLFKPVTGEGGPLFDKFKLWIAGNVLLHEMVHQFLDETRELDINEQQHMWHGHKFMEVCNRIGAELELQPVYMNQRPYCYAWPDSALTRKQIKQAMNGLNQRERRLAFRLVKHLAQNGPDGGGTPTDGGSVVRQESILVA